MDQPRTLPSHLFRLLALGVGIIFASSTLAGPREQAKRIHDRLTGTPPSTAVLNAMSTDISNGNPLAAAYKALDNSSFYNVTLKNLATPWTNRAQTVFAPLNDYTATVIGMVRDNVPFNQLLSSDIVYIADPALGLPPYSTSDNRHYEELENRGLDMKTALVQRSQSSQNGLPPEATAGVLTSRAAAEAFFQAGTNRAMLRFTLLNHLGNDLEQIKDNTRPHDRVRQDVSRSPGGDSRIFNNSCVSCHAGMDPLAQAFAYYDFDAAAGRMVYNTPGTIDPSSGTRVKGKYLINASNFEYGYITPDDRWDNYWRKGPNARLGWDTNLPGGGNGAKLLGIELGNSEAFARYQVEKVLKAVCLRPPGNAQDRSKIDAMVSSFKATNYNLKQVFAESAVYCMGD